MKNKLMGRCCNGISLSVMFSDYINSEHDIMPVLSSGMRPTALICGWF